MNRTDYEAARLTLKTAIESAISQGLSSRVLHLSSNDLDAIESRLNDAGVDTDALLVLLSEGNASRIDA